MTNQKFGKLTVISYDKKKSEKKGKAYWFCQCDCGSDIISIRGDALTGGKKVSCNCIRLKNSLSRTIERLQGSVWGNLIYVKFVKKVKTNNYVMVRCTCGNQEVVNEKYLREITECSKCRSKHAKKRVAHNFIDITNRRFGKLLVIRYLYASKWMCRCDCGNYYIVNSTLLRKGTTTACPLCNDKHKHHVKFVDLSGKTFGMLVVTSFNRFSQGHTYWNCVCTCQDKTEVVVDGDKLKRGATTSCGCRFVQHRGSNAENDILMWISKNYPYLAIEKHNRHILDGKEIDILLPNNNIGIEYNGSEWHASLGNIHADKPKYYHRDKFLLAKEKGVHLISIFDVDWDNNQEKIRMYLNYLFSYDFKYIYARECKCSLIDKCVADEFTNDYHIQGDTPFNRISYGLFYFDELVAVMSFGNLRMRKTEAGQYELHRYCVKDGFKICGGANKLLKAFERDYNPKYLLSYSDNDYFLGDIYERLGFECKGQCTPRYYWYLGGKQIKREKCRISNLDLTDVLDAKLHNAPNIEDYVMLSKGACKVWRSGNTKWEKVYS